MFKYIEVQRNNEIVSYLQKRKFKGEKFKVFFSQPIIFNTYVFIMMNMINTDEFCTPASANGRTTYSIVGRSGK